MMFRFLHRNKYNIKPWFSNFLYFLKTNREIMWSEKRETMMFRFLHRNRWNIKVAIILHLKRSVPRRLPDLGVRDVPHSQTAEDFPPTSPTTTHLPTRPHRFCAPAAAVDRPSGSGGSGRRSRGGSFPSRQSVEGDPRNKGDGSGEPTGAAGARGCEHPAEPGARRAGTGDRGRASGATESPGRGAGPLPRVVSGPGSLGKQAPASRDVPSAATTLARRHERRAARGSRRPDGRGRTPGAAESTGRGAGQPPRVSSGPGEPGTASLGVPRRAVCH